MEIEGASMNVVEFLDLEKLEACVYASEDHIPLPLAKSKA